MLIVKFLVHRFHTIVPKRVVIAEGKKSEYQCKAKPLTESIYL